MSGFTLRQTPTSPSIREWFGTNGNDSGLGFDSGTGVIGSQDIAYGYQGNDSIDVGFSTSSQAFGGQGDDTLIGSPVFISITRLFGNDGNDVILMKGGTASFGSGGRGDDSLVGSGGTTIDSLWGGQGNDVLRGLSGADFLSGDLGQDIIWGDDGGGTGNDTILGGGESDTIVGGNGHDSIHGGQGNDYIDTDAALVFDSTNGVNRIPTNTDVVSGNDTVWGEAGDDTIGRETSTGNEVYSGGDGNDSVVGGEGSDSITGDAGDDILRGGNWDGGTTSGRDTIVGGTGNDSIQGGDEDGGSVIPGAPDYVVTDSLVGAEGDDTINGNRGNDLLDGGIGKDSLLGGDGNDIALGGDQADTLRGEDGADSLVGGRDNDLLEGGKGSDTLTGGLTGDTPTSNTPGEDTFRYNITSLVSFLGTGLVDTGAGKLPEADLITDFNVASDRIEVVEASTTISAAVGNIAVGSYNFGGTFGGSGLNGDGAGLAFGQIGAANDTVNGVTGAYVFVETGDAAAAAANTFSATNDVVLAFLNGVTAAQLTSSNFI
jgi:Ca2+-binding RTX toxin-like protein